MNKILDWLDSLLIHNSFQREVRRWFRDKGDSTLRLDYPLDTESIVLDVGGYKGDFTALIHEKFNCRVFVFEPVSVFYHICKKRFAGNAKITALNYGLSDTDEVSQVYIAQDSSSFYKRTSKASAEIAQLRNCATVFQELGLEKVDLMKINIEGGEYNLVRKLIDSNLIEKIKYLQIQFHNFVENSEEKRQNLRSQLTRTHIEMWNYEFVWESWQLKNI
ncbi:FkbM family methyltransferase [Thermosynechococcus sp. HN-54]|uniref:FkbM family methyltransferase n=1 Tax=Thermosynechococcus sp. HN-54 TaxID=2933959 RepID=UPI00202CBC2A|nr:FkbM family methyltransferase [Thermosynechococcus sp. HN-54]URR34730.1 FkbM family methyltransferase [Thermosynechococcus sp. HN-54]